MNPDTTVHVGVLANFVQPLIDAILPLLWTAIGGYVASFLPGWVKTVLTDKNWQVVHSAALAAAQRYWAASTTSIATASIDVGSPGIARAANTAIDTIPKIAAALGVTPEAMEALIAAKLGQLQVQATSASVAPVVQAEDTRGPTP
jgi:hypothetical protein